MVNSIASIGIVSLYNRYIIPCIPTYVFVNANNNKIISNNTVGTYHNKPIIIFFVYNKKYFKQKCGMNLRHKFLTN